MEIHCDKDVASAGTSLIKEPTQFAKYNPMAVVRVLLQCCFLPIIEALSQGKALLNVLFIRISNPLTPFRASIEGTLEFVYDYRAARSHDACRVLEAGSCSSREELIMQCAHYLLGLTVADNQ